MSAKANLELFRQYEGDLSAFRERARNFINFYYGEQYDQDTKDSLKLMGLTPLVINIIRPLILQQLSILTSSKPTWKVVPLKGASKEVADISGRFLIGKWNADYTDIQLAHALFDMLITGVGWLFVDRASFIDNATFELTIERVNYKYVYPDPRCTKFDFSDAENIFVRKLLGISRAAVVYGLTAEQVGEATKSVASEDSFDQPVELIDRFSKYPVYRYDYTIKSTDTYTPDLRDLPKRPLFLDRNDKKWKSEEESAIRELNSLMVDGKIELNRMKDLNIHRCLSLGEYEIYNGLMNIRDYPIIGFTNEFTDEAARISGEVNSLLGIQEAHNKYYLLVLHNAMLTGNVRVLAAKKVIKDVAAFQKTWALPGVVWEWEPQTDLPDGGKPQIIQPGQLSSAFYGLSQDLMRKAEYESAVFGPLQGNPATSPETFSTTSTLQNFGAQRIKFNARKVDIQIAKAGEVMMQFIQNYAPADQLLTYIDDKPLTDDGQVNQEYGNEVEAGKINETVMNAGIVAKIKNDASIGHYSVKILTQPNLGTDRMIKASYLSNMIMNKAIPPTPAVIKKVMDLMEVPGYTEIVAEMTKGANNEQMVQQLVQQVKQYEKALAQAQKEIGKLTTKVQDTELKLALEKEVHKLTQDFQGAKEKLAGEVANFVQTQGESTDAG